MNVSPMGIAYECFMMFHYSILPCLSLGHDLKIFLVFYQFEPQCSYKRVLIKTRLDTARVSIGRFQKLFLKISFVSKFCKIVKF